MELRHLRYFVAAAEAGSLTAAARALGVKQPTLTVALRELEEELGTTLLHRSRLGVTPTSTGDALAAHAREVFATLERADAQIRGLEEGDVGSFVVGCHESLGAYFLPGFMRRFLVDSPSIEITLWNGTSAAVLEAVVARRVDFGVVVNPRPHPDLVLVDMFRDRVEVVSLVERGEPPRDLEAACARLRKGPLILAGRVQQCQELVDRLAAMGALPERFLSCGDLGLVKSLALGGVGVALLPRRVAAYGHPGRLAPLSAELPFIPDAIRLVYRADLHRTRAGTRLKDALLRHGRSLEVERSKARA